MLAAAPARRFLVAHGAERAAWRRRGERWAPGLVLAIGLAVQVVMLVHYARRLWFFGDDWEFLLDRSITHDTLHSLFAPHNEHWSTLPVIAFRLMFSIFGVAHYLPYAMMPIAAHVTLFALFYVLLRRHTVGPWPAVVATLVTAYLAGGAGAENTLWDFQIGFIGSCLFGVAALLALSFPGRWANVVAVVALVLSLMCSGLGLIMVGWAALVLLFRRGLLGAVWIAAVPAIVYALWYVLIGHTGAGSGAASPVASIAPVAAVTGISDVWSVATGMTTAGPAVVLAMIAATGLVRRRVAVLFPLALGGLIAFALAFALFGYSRSGLGATATEASRYQYVALLLSGSAVAAAVALAARTLRETPWGGVVSGAVTLGLVGSLGVAQLGQFVTTRDATTLPRLKGRLAVAMSYATSGAPLLANAPDPTYSPDITLAKLLAPKVRGTLPRVRPSAQDRFEVAAALLSRTSTHDSGLPSYATVSWSGFPGVGATVRPLRACVTHVAGPGAAVTFGPMPTGGEALITSPGPSVQTQIVKGGLASMPANRHVPADRPAYVAATVPNVMLRVYLPGGPVTVCPA